MKSNMIIVGDLHLGLVYKGINFSDRIVKCLNEVHKDIIEEEEKPSAIIFLGDIFHLANPSIDELDQAFEIIENWSMLGCNIFFLRGNHDIKIKRNQNTEPFKFLERVVNQTHFKDSISFIMKPEYFFNDYIECYFLFLPYITDGEALLKDFDSAQEYIDDFSRRALEQFKKKSKRPIYIFSHLDYKKAKLGSETQMLCSGELSIPKCLLNNKQVKRIFNGHLHLPQEFEKEKIIMPGSLESLRFGEGSKKYYLKVGI